MANANWRVFLAEDDEDDYFLVKEMLSEIKHTDISIDWEADYEAARAAILCGGYDVYLLDYRLGQETGLSLLREAISEGCAAPIILLTGQDNPQTDYEAMQAGAADYLIKNHLTGSLLERAIRYAIERRRTLEALRQSEERYALAARGSNDGLWDWDIVKDEVYYSPRWKAMLGYGEEELSNSRKELVMRLHQDDWPGVKAAWERLKNSQAEHFTCEYRVLSKDGEYRWAQARCVAVRDKNGSPVRLVGSQADIHDQRRAEQQLLHDALHDALTGLPNRTLFMDRLEQSLRRAHRRFAPLFGVLFLDLDRFKVINDSLGHTLGDLLLVEIARRLEAVLRPGDTIARWGGDEFTVLLEDVADAEDAAQIAERLQRELEQPFVLGSQEVFTSVSIGIALGASEYERPEEIVRDADTAMYRAKAQGNGQQQLFDKSMHDRAMDLLQIENDLRRALERNEFVVHYQPIIDLKSGRICSFESLVRWQHPTRGLVPPADFIPLAEETGQILQLGMWVLRESCAQLRRWKNEREDAANLSVCVNLSARQITQKDLVQQVRAVINEYRLAPGSLKIEITESAVMKDIDAAIEILNELRALGVEFCVDDFGTGHSSLGYLQRLPIKMLKIDRSFISRMNDNNKDGELVCTIVELARRLNINVVAEGVETQEQLDILKKLHCQYGQGFLFSRPVAVEFINALLPNYRQDLAA
jgi:diguanylate cyclase (GGDEF)-like protein/PAS domain S-box-containing protein